MISVSLAPDAVRIAALDAPPSPTTGDGGASGGCNPHCVWLEASFPVTGIAYPGLPMAEHLGLQ